MKKSFLAAGVLLGLLVVALVGLGAAWSGRRATPSLPATATVAPLAAATSPSPTVGSPPLEATPTLGVLLSPTPSATPPALESAPPPAAAFESLEAIRAADIPGRDPLALAIGFGLVPSDTPRVVRESPPDYVLGNTQEFSVSNVFENTHRGQIAALRFQTEHASWWVQEGFNVSDEEIRRSAERFEEETYPLNREIFGSEWSPGVDGDPRVHIFIGEVPGVAGYFSSADELPREVNPYSNEREMFYINLENARPGEDYFDGVLAHEFQHMIHWNIDRNEDLWVNEGMSELAVALNGHSVGGNDYLFAREPDLQLTTWGENGAAHYGASYLFMQYLYDRFGADTIRAIVAEPRNGASGVEAVLAPQGHSFDQVFADWVAHNFVSQTASTNADRSLAPSVSMTFSRFPADGTATVSQYGTDYIRFEPTQARGQLEVRFQGGQQVALLPTTPSEGSYVAWSNRGDDANTWLTRGFDLRGLQAATLRFDLWYDFEDGWDYGYVSVSVDGGTSWQIVPGEQTTTDNPSGNAFGPAYTGLSGRGENAAWVTEEVDLTPFVGQEVLVRFQMVTDDAQNRPGLALDRITLPELNYSEGFEQGLGGWEPEGFVRVDNVLPQQFLVQALIVGDDGSTTIERMDLDPTTNTTTLTVPDFGNGVRDVVIAISGLTPFTTEPGTYGYEAAVTP